MAIIGVKELKAKTSSVIRSLKEKKADSYLITHRGKPVAKLLPVSDEDIEDAIMALENPKFREFIEKIKKEESISWDRVVGGAKSETASRGKKKSK